jgi:probable rRNA maturation factor
LPDPGPDGETIDDTAGQANSATHGQRRKHVITIEVADEQTKLPVDPARLRNAVARVLQGECVTAATLSIAVVDDPTIHELNRRYLQHDYPTDVLSFRLDEDADAVEGEVVVSVETATRQAERFGWTPHEELILYVVHGTLHLLGYDDHNEQDRAAMREQERFYLNQLGCVPRNADEE